MARHNYLGTVYPSQRPAWAQYAGPGHAIDPYDIPDEILDQWIETSPGQVGWHATSQSGQLGCYCWGYRPKNNPQTLGGTRWASQVQPWKICEFACRTTCPPATVCAPPTVCPPKVDCPTCPEQTTCEKPAEDISRSKNWLWAVGFGVLIAGVYGVRRTMALRR